MMAATLARGTTDDSQRRARTGDRRSRRTAQQDGRARARRRHQQTIEIEGVEALGGARAHDHSRPHRDRNVHRRRGDHATANSKSKTASPEHLTVVIEKLREVGVEIEELNPSTLRRHVSGRRSDGERRHDRAASGVSDRHAGAVHGADDAGRRAIGDRRKQFLKIVSCTRRSCSAWARRFRSTADSAIGRRTDATDRRAA